MKTTAKPTIKWLAALAVALVVISLILVPQVLKVESRAANVDTPTYTANTSWYSSAGTYTLTTPQEVLGFFQLLAGGTTFSGSTIQLGCDIDLNPGVNLQMTYSSPNLYIPTATNAIYVGDKIKNNSSDGRWFFGTFDGQGYTLRGVYSKYTYGSNGCSGTNVAGLFGNLRNDSGCGSIKNLVVLNSYIEWYGEYDGAQIGGLCSCLRGNASVTNCYLDIDICARNKLNYKSYIGAIACYGGTVANQKATISNVVYAGTCAMTNGKNSTAIRGGEGATTNGIIGCLYMNGNSVAANVTDVLNLGVAYTNAANNNTGNGVSTTGNNYGGLSQTRVLGSFGYNTANTSQQASNPSGGSWTYVSEVGSYLPGGVAGLSHFRYQLWYNTPTGSTYTLTTKEQLLGFFDLLATGTQFSGQTIKLGNSIDLNPSWNGNLLVSGSTPTYPTTPTNSIYTGDKLKCESGTGRWFLGTFDGQGYAIRGIYSYYNNNVASSGIFGAMARVVSSTAYCGSIQNLIIQNSCLIHQGYVDQLVSSAICTAFRGTASISNCYFDVDLAVWNGDTFQSCTGAIVAGGGSQTGTASFSNIVWAGTIADCNSTGSAIKSGTTNGRIGLFYQNAASTAFSATDVLNMGTVYCNLAENNSGNGLSNTGNTSSTTYTPTRVQGTFRKGDYVPYREEGSPSGWAWCTAFSGYIPSGVNNLTGFLKTSGGFLVDAAISSYTISNGSSAVPEGSSFVIGSKSDFDSLVTKLNSDAGRGRNLYFKLTSDISYGSANDAKVVLNAAGTSVTTWPGSNNFTVIDGLYGVLNGQGHVISGIISKQTITSGGFVGSFITRLGGTLTNLALVDCFFCGDQSSLTATSLNEYYGGVVGYATNSIINHMIIDADIWLKYKSGSYYTFGGVVGVVTGNQSPFLYMNNITLTGRFAVTRGANDIVVETTDGYAGFLVGSGNGRTVGLADSLVSCMRRTITANYDYNHKYQFCHRGPEYVDATNLVITSSTSGSNSKSRAYDAKDPTTGLGSTYKYLQSIGHFVLADNYTTFSAVLNSAPSLQMWAQKNNNDSSTVRIVSKVYKSMAEDASAIGFYLTWGTKHATMPLTGVYKAITAGSSTYTASSLTGKGDYLMAFVITGFQSGATITIEPYFIINGQTYYGTATSYTYGN